MVDLGPLGPIDGNGRSLDTVPESLTDDDLDWVNEQLAVVDRQAVRCVAGQGRPAPYDTSWITMERIRG